MVFNRNKIIAGTFLLFLLLHAVPFLNRYSYQLITIFNYSVVLPLLMITTIRFNCWVRIEKTAFLLCLIGISLLMYVFGLSGSISAFILCASVPFFVFCHIKSFHELVDIIYLPLKIATIVLILFGFYLFIDLKDQLMEFYFLGEFFVTASINYVSLTFYSFSISFLVMISIKERYVSVPSKFDYFLGFVLILLSVFFSFVYLTRSTFIVSLIFLVLYFRRFTKIIFIAAVCFMIIYGITLLNYLNFFLGDSNFSAVASDFKRMNSIELLVKSALSFDYNFSNHMSFSSVMNLLFCLFPLSLFFIWDILSSFIIIWKINRLYLFVFPLSLFIVIYQMDFLSIFMFFIIIEIMFFEKRTQIMVNAS